MSKVIKRVVIRHTHWQLCWQGSALGRGAAYKKRNKK